MLEHSGRPPPAPPPPSLPPLETLELELELEVVGLVPVVETLVVPPPEPEASSAVESEQPVEVASKHPTRAMVREVIARAFSKPRSSAKAPLFALFREAPSGEPAHAGTRSDLFSQRRTVPWTDRSEVRHASMARSA